MNKLKPILSARKDCTISYTIVILAFILIQTMIATGNITSSLKGQLVPICAYIVMAISLNLTVGILGELSLGHAGFMSVGAFTGIVVSTSLAAAIPNGPLRLAISMIIGGLFAGIAGLIVGIPVLRLRVTILPSLPLHSVKLSRILSTCSISVWMKKDCTSAFWNSILPLQRAVP